MASVDYDVAIVGGGLGGLSLSILLAQKKYRVLLLEKESYPFHKVCGEYISNESRPFLEYLGIDLQQWSVPNIQRVTITTPKGKALKSPLGLGGFGISRYQLDAALADKAREAGVTLLENTRVEDVSFANDQFSVGTKEQTYTVNIVAGAYGRRSNLDLKLKRPFALQKPLSKDNYIGVKYHAHLSDFPENLIELHNFAEGYCGMSRIEEDKLCICYLTTASKLREYKGQLEQLEAGELIRNPLLAERLGKAQKLFQAPVTIAQVTFKAKQAVEDHMLMLGDAAGTIAPLCGNGMSMSMHASWMLYQLLEPFFKGQLTRAGLEQHYAKQWHKQFQLRIKAGYYLQQLFGKEKLTESSIGLLGHLPGLTRQLIKLTHGQDFMR